MERLRTKTAALADMSESSDAASVDEPDGDDAEMPGEKCKV